MTDAKTLYAFYGNDYLNLPREPETWLVRSVVPTGGAVLMYGEPKVGKSYAAIQLALAIEAGADWLGFQVVTQGPVLYIQLDTPRNLWAARMEELRASGCPIEKLICADRETFGEYPLNITDKSHWAKVRETVDHYKPVATVIDTLREIHPGDENTSENMRNVIAAISSATQPSAMILITHSRKPKEDQEPNIMNDIRGANYVPGRMDAILRMGKKSLHYSGRAIEEGSIMLHRQENGFWTPATADTDGLIAKIMTDETLTTYVSRAKALAEITGKTEEACRSLIRRSERRALKAVNSGIEEPTGKATRETTRAENVA